MLHTNALVYAKLDLFNKRIAFAKFCQGVQLSRQEAKLTQTTEMRITRKAFTCLRAESSERKTELRLLRVTFKYFRLGIA